MNKSRFFCVLMTIVLTVALCVGGGAMLTVSDRACSPGGISSSAPSGSDEGSDVTVGQSALPTGFSTSHASNVTADTSGTQTKINVSYSGAAMTLTIPAGKYEFELWGASGGGDVPSTMGGYSGAAGSATWTVNSTSNAASTAYRNTTWHNQSSEGGAGGYVAAQLAVSSTTTLNLYVGGAGSYGASAAGGWNGGGKASTGTCGSGGGATDIRIGGTTLNHRVIVAGAGGGADNTHAAGTARGTDDDGSGGAGGGNGTSTGSAGCGSAQQPIVQGVYKGSYATQTGIAGSNTVDSSHTGVSGSFGIGATPTLATDTGGGGGGWYGGSASNHNQGGGGGGSSYILTSGSYRPSGYAHNTSSPYNMTPLRSYAGIWNGNGKMRITVLESSPSNKSANLGSVTRTADKAIVPTDVATDPDLSVTGYNEKLSFVSPFKIYTNSACTTLADDYVAYKTTTADKIELHAKRIFPATTFYTKVQDKTSRQVVASFTLTSSSYSMATASGSYGLKNSNTGLYGLSQRTGANYPSLTDIDGTANGYWGYGTDYSDLYNATATGRLTYMITKPLELGSGRWGGLTSATVRASDLAAAVDKYGGALLDDVYFTTYTASGDGTNYMLSATGSASKWSQLTVTPTLANKSGWFTVPVTIGLFQKAAGTTGAGKEISTVAQRISVDIVFRVGNARPTLNTPLTVELNTTTKKTQTVSISQLVSDPNSNDLSFYAGSLTDVVKVPRYEYYNVNKFGTAIATNGYNVGTAKSDVVDSAESTTETGFDQSSIYNSGMANAAEVYKKAYVGYSLSGTSIVFTAIRGSHDQYSSSRTTNHGHFYILVHLTDSGDTRDTGIWVPIAIKVTDTSAPDVRSLDFTLSAADVDETGNTRTDPDGNLKVGESVVISPYYVSSFPDKGIGALAEADAANPDNFVSYALGRDNSEFSTAFGGSGFLFNDFLGVNSDFGNITPGAADSYGTLYADYTGFTKYVSAQVVNLFAPAAWFSHLDSTQQARAGITINGTVAVFKGIRLTALTSTKDRWVEIPVVLNDIWGNKSEAFIAVKVNDRAPEIRNTVNEQGELAKRSEKEIVDTDGNTVKSVTVTYTTKNISSAVYKISPYDLIFDADLAKVPTVNNSDRSKNNSNPDDRGNADLANALYASPNRVVVRTALDAAGTHTTLGHDTISFVPSSLPFTELAGGVYRQNRYERELVLHYCPSTKSESGGTMDYFEFSPRFRNSGNSAYTFEDVRIIDESGEIVSINLEVRVINSLPEFKPDIPVFYLMADYTNNLYLNSSQTGSGADADNIGSSYNTVFGLGAYNVREFAIREFITDPDQGDEATLSIVSVPELGYLDTNGEFVADPTYSKYVSFEYNVPGSGRRGGYEVIRVTGKNSTQSLARGLFMQVEVTDGFNNGEDRIKLAFQIEVMNSAPVFIGASQFEYKENDTTNYWNIQPANYSDTVATRYIAPDETTARLLTSTGVMNGANRMKVSASNVKYFALDYDELQHIMPYTLDTTNLPRTAQNGVVDEHSDIAVRFDYPYGTTIDDTAAVNNTVTIQWYILGSDNEYHIVDPNDASDLAKYGTTLEECLNGDILRWALKITPVTGFKEAGLTVTLGYRDSSPEGGETTGRNPNSYKGVRPDSGTPNASVEAHAFVTFNITIDSLGITNNQVAYSNPSDAAKDNLYYAYYTDKDASGNPSYEAVYPSIVYGAPEFRYLPIALENETSIANVPLSYLAIPTAVGEGMESTVDFEKAYNITSESGSSYRASADELTNMYMNMSLYDPATGMTWSGAELAHNPYLDIRLASASEISSDKYLNKKLYYTNPDYDASVTGSNKLLERNTSGTNPLREDTFGFKLSKKSVRSRGYLELSVSLSEYRYADGSGTSYASATANRQDKVTVVKLYVSVPNEKIEFVTDGGTYKSTVELSTAALTAVNGERVEFTRGKQDGVITLANDASRSSLPKTKYRIFADYDKNDYTDTAHDLDGNVRTFKETAYFLSNSIGGDLTREQLAYILEPGATGGRANSVVSDERLAAYFGVDVSALASLANAASGGGSVSSLISVNPGYRNFFTVSPTSRDDTSLSFHPVRRISIDAQTAYDYANGGAEPATVEAKVTAYQTYIDSQPLLKGLKARANGNDVEVYYPFRVIIYDDYESSGFLDGSYEVLEIDVLIGNAKPYVNSAMTVEKEVNNVLERVYELDVAKGEAYAVRISDIFGDDDMILDSSRNFFDKEALKDDVLALNTSDFFTVGEANTLTLSYASNITDVAIDFNGKYNATAKSDMNTTVAAGEVHKNSLIDGRIRLTAINRTNDELYFKVWFSDNSGADAVSVVFHVSIGNQAPVRLVKDANQTYVTSSDIVMRTGEVFTLLPTSWDKYIGGLDALGIASAGLDDDFYTSSFDNRYGDMIDDRYGINGGDSDYAQFGSRQRKSTTDSGAYVPFKFSEEGKKVNLDNKPFIFDSTAPNVHTYSYTDLNGKTHDGNLGFLALADDDLPWGLKFSNTNPISIPTSAVTYRALNLVGSNRYAMAIQFRAVSGCTNVPVTFTVNDSEGKSIQFTFRITVKNSTPYTLDNSVSPSSGLTFNGDDGIYEARLMYGDTLRIPVTSIVSDRDEKDRMNLRTLRAYNGCSFIIDGMEGVSENAYVSIDDNSTEIVIRCNGVFLAGDKSYTDIKFSVVDPLGAAVEVTIRVRTDYSGLSDSKNAAEFAVDSVSAYKTAQTPSEFTLVTRPAPDGSVVSGCVVDGDYGSNAVYTVGVFAMFDITVNADGTKTLKSVDKETVLANRADYRILTYDAEEKRHDFTPVESAKARLAYIREYFDFTVSEDGSRILLTPYCTTYANKIPLYIEMVKVVSGANQLGQSANLTAGTQVNVTVTDSAPTAIGNNVTNQGYFTGPMASRDFLTVRGTAGYSQSYSLWNRERNDIGLFTDNDATDELTFVSAAVTDIVDEGGNVTPAPNGWQASGSLKQAYSVAVKDGILTASVVRKVVDPKDPERPFTLPVKVTVKDKMGNTADTVITFMIYNSAPQFIEYANENKPYKVSYVAGAAGYDGEYLLEMSVKAGETGHIDVGDFLSDNDMASGENFTIAADTDNTELSLHDLDSAVNPNLAAVHYAKNAAKENMFAIRLENKDNLHFAVQGISSNRGESAEAILILTDSSLGRTLRLRMRFTVANSSPVATDKSREITLLGGDDEDALSRAFTEISITDWLLDPNDADNGGSKYPLSTTFMRIYSYEYGNVRVGDEYVDASDDTNLFTAVQPVENNRMLQKLRLNPVAGRYGSQEIKIYVTDDGAINAEGSVIVSFTLNITVARDVSLITLLPQTVTYMNPFEINVEKIIPSEYVLGYSLESLRVSSLNNPRNAVAVEKDEEGKYYVKALVREADRAVLIAKLRVGDVTKELEFSVNIRDNLAPNYYDVGGEYLTKYTYERADLDSMSTVRLFATDWFKDPEGDDMTLLDVSSSHTFIVKASVDKESNRLVLQFKACGSSEITVWLTDATGDKYERKITVTNNTLPELNFFLKIMQNFVLNIWLWLVVIFAILLLLLLLIFLIGVRRKKKREQEEVEALLASEIQIEEQMLRIAAAQQNRDAAMLPPPYSQGQLPPQGLPPYSQGQIPPNMQLPNGSPQQGDSSLSQLPPPPNGNGFDDNNF